MAGRSATQENIKLTINSGKFSGYAALNIVGSGSEVIVNNAELIGINNASIHESNGFAAISIGDVTYGSVTKGVKLTVNGGTITATSQGNVQNILCTSWNTEEVEAVIDAQLITYNGGIMYGEADVASFRAEYADELEAQGYIVSEPVDGMGN